jgi:hypothetical protein
MGKASFEVQMKLALYHTTHYKPKLNLSGNILCRHPFTTPIQNVSTIHRIISQMKHYTHGEMYMT